VYANARQFCSMSDPWGELPPRRMASHSGGSVTSTPCLCRVRVGVRVKAKAAVAVGVGVSGKANDGFRLAYPVDPNPDPVHDPFVYIVTIVARA